MSVDAGAAFDAALTRLSRGAAPPRHRITRRAGLALRVLCDATGPLTTSELAGFMGVHWSGVSRTVARMLTDTLVIKRSDPTDRRLTLISPSSAGRALDQRIRALAASIEEHAA